MLGLKSFRSAAITLAGVELAHRVRKQQYSLPKGMKGRAGSLKELWDAALADSGAPMCRDGDRPTPTHQNSADHFQPARGRVHPEGRVRYPRKISFGGNLYLLVRPQGGRYWHYHYRYGGKRKTLSLGTYPDVPIAGAQSRHRAARRLLAAGVDPSLRRSCGANCGVSRARSLMSVLGIPGNGFEPRRRIEIGLKCSLMVTQTLVS